MRNGRISIHSCDQSNKGIRKQLECAIECIDEDGEDLPFEKLDEIVYRSEMAALCARSRVSQLEAAAEITDASLSQDMDLPVSIDVRSEELEILLPYIYRRAGKEYGQRNFLMALYVRNALERWELDHRVKLSSFFRKGFGSERLVCIFERRSPVFNGSIADNDNLEAGRIINAIFGQTLLYGDNANSLDLFLTYSEGHEPSTFIKIVTRSRFFRMGMRSE